jgi:hypothetical protein
MFRVISEENAMRPLSIVPLLGLVACSPYSFQKEVSAFTTGVNQLSDAFTSGYGNLATDQAALIQLQLTDAHASISITPSCDLLPSSVPASQQPCALYAKNGPAPAPVTPDPNKAITDKDLAVLKGYANALSAVTNAADRASYDTAVSQLSNAVGDVAKAANAVAPGAGTIAPAAINLAGWIVGTALDQARFDALKQAVNACDTPVTTVSAALDVGLAAISSATINLLYQEMRQLVGSLGNSTNDATYKARYAQADALRTTINSLRQNDPAATAASLAKAHHALMEAVNDPSRNYPALVTAIGDFESKAEALKTAVAPEPAPKTKS